MHWPTVLLTYAIGTLGGLAARAIGVPLPLLSGALLAVGAAALIGWRPLGQLPQVPQRLRVAFLPVIGLGIGAAFTPRVAAAIPHWLPSLAAVVVFVPLVHWICYRLVRALSDLDPATALFGAAPGGLVETVEMGAALGGNVQMLTLLQFLRLILTILIVPTVFTVTSGHAVGSAAGVQMPGAGMPSLADAALLVAMGAAGAWIGLRLRLPAAPILGPVVLSAAAHATGLTAAAPPGWLVGATQIVIGTSLGVRFAGMPRGHLLLGLRLAAVNVSATLTIAGIFAAALAPIVKEPVSAVLLAFAPGGLAEMGLVALSLQLSVIYVTAHHLMRIILSVTVARSFARRLRT